MIALDPSQELAALFRFPAAWAGRTPPRIVIAGGVARSGTTYLEGILQVHPQVLAAQEFMPLKTPMLADLFAHLTQCTTLERAMWSDAAGRQWRGYAASEDSARLANLFLTCLLSTTRADLIRAKRPEAIRMVYCKTPGAEMAMPRLKPALAALDLRYVHSIRNPVSCLRSCWEMPWVRVDDPNVFVRDFAETLRYSADAFLAIRAAGIPAHVVCADRLWDASTRGQTIERTLGFLEIDSDDALFSQAERHVDPWPRERRRTPPIEITQVHEEAFLAEPGIARWREIFAAEL